MPLRRTRALAVTGPAVALAAIAVLTGCGSSSSSSGSSPSTSPSTSAATAGSARAASSAASTGTLPNPCQVVTKEMVAAVLGTQAPDGKEQKALSGTKDTCSYGGVGGTAEMTVDGTEGGLDIGVDQLTGGDDQFEAFYLGGDAGFSDADKTSKISGKAAYAKIIPASLGTGDAVRVVVRTSGDRVLDLRLGTDYTSQQPKLATQKYVDELVELAVQGAPSLS